MNSIVPEEYNPKNKLNSSNSNFKYNMQPVQQSFWHRLELPIMALAPMEDVTDTVFRQMILECGRPSVMFTEFTNCEGAQSVGQARVVHRLRYTDQERPLVAQVWGVTPADYYKTAIMIRELGFDGIDINMGCPVRNIIKQGACSALIKNPSLAKEIVLAAKEGMGDLPISIKTRIGFRDIETEAWIGFLLRECQPVVLTIHGRTVKEASRVPNHWDEIGKAAKLRQEIGSQTLIIGNGDVESLAQARSLAEEYALDGIMIGRGVFKNPWIFDPTVDPSSVSLTRRLELLSRHVTLFQITWGSQKHINILKKYFKIYLNGFSGAAELRNKLMGLDSSGSLLEHLEHLRSSMANSPN